MDNIKTGTLIKELRKEKGMTQKQLATLLHITDRAVSKWERGLCAPDIALLEPLSAILGTSILELIEGNKIVQVESLHKLNANAKTMIDYSQNEIAYKLKIAKRKYIGMIVAGVTLVLLIGGWFLWRNGYFYIIDKSISPNEKHYITIYDKNFSDFADHGFSMEDATSIIMKDKDDMDKSTRITYGECVYQGIWWAPDSKKYVISLKYDDHNYLALNWLERNSESNLSAYLSMGVDMSELSKYGYASQDLFPEIKYQFLQWALDSASMLIYYSFEDKAHQMHDGYFWYNCELGTVRSVLEMAS